MATLQPVQDDPAPAAAEPEKIPKVPKMKRQVKQTLLDSSKQQLRIAQESWDLYKNITLPYEEAVMRTNMELLPQVAGYQKKVLEDAIGSFEEERALRSEMRAGAMEGLQNQRAVQGAFMKELEKGPQTQEKMREAQGDVAQSYAAGESEATRTMGRMGMGGDSSSVVDAIARMKTNKVKDTAGARNMARNKAEADHFGRLTAGMQLFSGAQGTATNAIATGSNPPAMPGMSSNYGQQSLQAYSGSADAAGKYIPVMTAKIANSESGEGFGQTFSQIGGAMGGMGQMLGGISKVGSLFGGSSQSSTPYMPAS